MLVNSLALALLFPLLTMDECRRLWCDDIFPIKRVRISLRVLRLAENLMLNVFRIAAIGRNPPYIITLFIYTILWVPASLVDNFAGFVVLRFLTGFFGKLLILL